jgi:hypothetical protein
MKKGSSALLFALMMMTMLVSNVSAAPNRNVTLKSVRYERSGIVLLFYSSGLSKEDLRNVSFTAHSMEWNLACNFLVDSTNVRCLVSKKLSAFAGEGFHGTLGGNYFSGQIPNSRIFPILAVAEIPVSSEPILLADTPIASDTSFSTEMPLECPAGQTLVYDFHWSGTAHSDGYLASSSTYYDADTFYAEFGSYYDYVSLTYNSENILAYSYYQHNTYTFTSSGSISPSQWDWYVDNMQSLGYSVELTGEHCEIL